MSCLRDAQCGSDVQLRPDEAGVVIAGPVPVAVLCHNRECDPIHAVTATKRRLVS